MIAEAFIGQYDGSSVQADLPPENWSGGSANLEASLSKSDTNDHHSKRKTESEDSSSGNKTTDGTHSQKIPTPQLDSSEDGFIQVVYRKRMQSLRRTLTPKHKNRYISTTKVKKTGTRKAHHLPSVV